ncbi:DEEPER ROOTING 1-like protein [Drosera capensis]
MIDAKRTTTRMSNEFIYFSKRMKGFSWGQNKFRGGKEIKKAPFDSTTRGHEKREEFSDWPNGLLAIGTLWNRSFKEESKSCNLQDASLPSQDFTPEEIRRLQEKLDALFSQESYSADSSSSTGQEHNELPVVKLLQHSQSSPPENNCGEMSCNSSDRYETDRLLSNISEVQRCKRDACPDKGSNAIRAKSLTFLLKKMFCWRSGIVPTPSFKDPLLYPESRMRKMLSAMLNKKVHPHSSRRTSSQKYLESQHKSRMKNDEDDHDYLQKGIDGTKWVKTDTEYIVLEGSGGVVLDLGLGNRIWGFFTHVGLVYEISVLGRNNSLCGSWAGRHGHPVTNITVSIIFLGMLPVSVYY